MRSRSAESTAAADTRIGNRLHYEGGDLGSRVHPEPKARPLRLRSGAAPSVPSLCCCVRGTRHHDLIRSRRSSDLRLTRSIRATVSFGEPRRDREKNGSRRYLAANRYLPHSTIPGVGERLGQFQLRRVPTCEWIPNRLRSARRTATVAHSGGPENAPTEPRQWSRQSCSLTALGAGVLALVFLTA